MMFETRNHIRNAQHILLMWFVFFALSPCVVKEALFSVADLEYAKPPTKTKTTAPANFCSYSQNDSSQIPVTIQTNINQQKKPVDVSGNIFFVVRSIRINTKYSKTYSGNSPPKYILYKRLRLDVV